MSLEYSWSGGFGTDTAETVQIPTGTTSTVTIPTNISSTTQAGSITVKVAESDTYRVTGTPATVTIQKLPKASITAITSTIQEASNAEIRIDLDRNADVIVNLDLQWSDGHGTATSSTVQFNASASETASISTTANGKDGSLTITVTTGTGYTVDTPSSATVTITKQVVPQAPETPTAPSVTGLSTTSLQVSWTAPTSTLPITAYTLEYKKTGETNWKTQSSTATTATITDLTVNTEYQVKVLATNSAGDSGFSSPGTGSTLDLTASISASPTEITEGDYVTFTVTLSRSENTLDDIDLNLTWVGNFGTQDSAIVQTPTGTTHNVVIATSTSRSVTAGSITATIADSTAYRSDDNTVTVPINKTITSHPPVTHRFPRGTPAKLAFDSPIASDTDGTEATYTFIFARPDQQESLTSSQALLSTEGPDEDHDFTIKAADGTTPAEFREMYGSESQTITLSGTLTARNIEQFNTQAVHFDLTLTYDDSPQFGEPAVYESNNRWKVEAPYEIYEGSTSLPDLSIPWTAFSNGERAWSAGTPTAITFQCYDQGVIRPAQWPADGEKDSEFFTVTSTAAATSGDATAAFKIAPDYEDPDDDEGSNPSDNTYQLRLVASHELHQTIADEPATGCDGSSVDVLVKVKDVGTPAPLELTGAYHDDNTKITFEFTPPTGFIEDGNVVTFPDPSFEPTGYEFRHRPASDDEWTVMTEVIDTSIHTRVIVQVQESSHQIQGRATNSEGTSPWPTLWTTISRGTQASISAVNSSITEGANAEFLVNLDVISSLTVNLMYEWTGSHGSTTSGTVTFTSSNSETLSIPTTKTGDAGSIKVTITSGTGYAIGNPNNAAVTIGRQATPPGTPTAPSLTALSSTSIRASWPPPRSQSSITGYTIRYSVANENNWTEQTSTITSATISNLKVNTAYEVMVQASNADGDSGFSEPTTGSTLDLAASIAADQSAVTEGESIIFTLTLSRATPTQVELQYAWVGDFGTSTNETIQTTTSKVSTVTVSTNIGTTSQPGSLTARIKPADAYRIVGTEASVSINKKPPPPPPEASIQAITSTVQEGQPAQFRVNLNKNADVTVNLTYSWTGNHGNATGGTVSFSSSDSETVSIPTTVVGNNGSLTVTITNGTGYTVGNTSSATATIFLHNLPPSRPARPSLTPLSTTAIRASWQEPPSLLTVDHYTLRYRENGTQQWTERNVNSTTYDMTSLTVNTKYQVQVQAHSAGASEWSQTSTESTQDLTVSITAAQASVTEGETAYFTITLSTPTSVQVDIQYRWDGNFGSTEAQQVQILSASTYDIGVPTTISTSNQNGSITASASTTNYYRVTGTLASVNINKIQVTEPPTPTPTEAPTPTPPTPEPTEAPTPEPTEAPTPTPTHRRQSQHRPRHRRQSRRRPRHRRQSRHRPRHRRRHQRQRQRKNLMAETAETAVTLLNQRRHHPLLNQRRNRPHRAAAHRAAAHRIAAHSAAAHRIAAHSAATYRVAAHCGTAYCGPTNRIHQ